MKPKDKKFIDNWGKTRKMGMKKFMIVVGGLWGVLTAIFMQFFELLDTSFKEAFFSKDFIIQLIIFIISGILLFGLIMWRINEKKYLKLTNSN